MATIDNIITRAEGIRDETTIGANTATRVGGVMVDTAEHLRDVEEQTIILAELDRIIGVEKVDMIPTSTATNWELRPNGLSAVNNSAQLVKYSVVEGQLLYLDLIKDTASVFQFQSASSVPASGTNTNLVGVPNSTDYKGLIIVPESATYLIVSCLQTNVTNVVALCSLKSDAQIKALNGSYFFELDFGSSSVARYAVRTAMYQIKNGHKYRVSIVTDNAVDTTYFSTRSDASHTVQSNLGTGIGSREFEFVATDDAPLIALSYANAGTGAVYEIEMLDLSVPSVMSNETRIEALESKGDGGISLPSYSKEEQQRVYDILCDRSKGNVHIVSFNTDQHFAIDLQNGGVHDPKWVMQGVQALVNIANLLPIDEIVFGGDYAGYSGDASSTAVGIMQEGNYLLQPAHDANSVVISIPGNHDAWQNTNTVTAQAMYNVNAKRNQRHGYYNGNGTDNCDAYVDDTEHKIRSIYVDTQSTNGRTESYSAFLTNALSTLPNDYMALVFSHNPLTNEFAGIVMAQKITDPSVEINAFQDPVDCHSILDTYASKIIACINGHTHFDASAVSASGILYIETTTAAPHTRNYTTDDIPNTSTLGTVTDTSFDFFVIDQSAVTIEAVRYGQGCNRKWKYKGADAGMVDGYPQAIVR